jgi:hypothetical protein
VPAPKVSAMLAPEVVVVPWMSTRPNRRAKWSPAGELAAPLTKETRRPPRRRGGRKQSPQPNLALPRHQNPALALTFPPNRALAHPPNPLSHQELNQRRRASDRRRSTREEGCVRRQQIADRPRHLADDTVDLLLSWKVRVDLFPSPLKKALGS